MDEVKKTQSSITSILILAYWGLIIAGFVLINNFYLNTKNPDANLTLIYQLNLSWFVLFWITIPSSVILLVMGSYLLYNHRTILGGSILTAGIVIVVLGLLSITALMVATVVEITKGSHYQDLYDPYVILITALVISAFVSLTAHKTAKHVKYTQTKP